MLKPIPKEDTPLSTYHIDFIGSLRTTNKKYNHIFSVIDAFNKVRVAVSSHDAISKLKQQAVIFGNSYHLIEPAFKAEEFKNYWEHEYIHHITTTTGVPRGNGQVERLHATLIPALAKLMIDDPTKWFKHVDAVQRTVNSTTSRSTQDNFF